jgi:hypothetical protein
MHIEILIAVLIALPVILAPATALWFTAKKK